MRCFLALSTVEGEEKANLAGAALEKTSPPPVGIGVFEIEDGSGLWEVWGQFASEPDSVALDLLAAAFGCAPFKVSELPETDWVSKVQRELPPIRTSRFFIHGSHDSESIPGGLTPLLIEASMAFGTGHHGTTIGCVKAMEALASAQPFMSSVADIGCGTGILAMAAFYLWRPETVFASDSDPVALEVAQANVSANQLESKIKCFLATGLDSPNYARPTFDLIVANILKDPLVSLATDVFQRTAPGGHVILSGILEGQTGEVTRAYEKTGLALLDTLRIGEWATLTFRMPPP